MRLFMHRDRTSNRLFAHGEKLHEKCIIALTFAHGETFCEKCIMALTKGTSA